MLIASLHSISLFCTMLVSSHSARSSATAQQRGIESHSSSEESADTPLLLEQEVSTDLSKQVKLGFLAGLVPREKFMASERILFCAARDNVFLWLSSVEAPMTDPVSKEKIEKNVVVVFHFGEKVKNKGLKISDVFGANHYSFPEDLGKYSQMITEVSGRLSELKITIDVGLLHRDSLL